MKMSLVSVLLASTLLLTACSTSTVATSSETMATTTTEATTTTTETISTTAETTRKAAKINLTYKEVDKALAKVFSTKEHSSSVVAANINMAPFLPKDDDYEPGFPSYTIGWNEGNNSYTLDLVVIEYKTDSVEYKNLTVGSKILTNDSFDDDELIVTAINGQYVLCLTEQTISGVNSLEGDELDIKTSTTSSSESYRSNLAKAIYDAFMSLK